MRQNEEQGNVFENKSPMPLFAVYSSLGGLLSPTETHRGLQGRNWRSLGGPTKAHQWEKLTWWQLWYHTGCQAQALVHL